MKDHLSNLELGDQGSFYRENSTLFNLEDWGTRSAEWTPSVRLLQLLDFDPSNPANPVVRMTRGFLSLASWRL